MTPICEVRIPVQLDRERTMIFDLNTMVAYEEAANKGIGEGEEPKAYWTTMLRLMEYQNDLGSEFQEFAGYKKGDDLAPEKFRRLVDLNMRIMKYVSARDIQCLLWASVHDYDTNDRPLWPLTLERIGRYIQPQTTIEIVNKFVRGHGGNSPSKEELGEASGGAKVVQMATAAVQPSQPKTGGDGSIDLDASAFA